MSRESIGPIAPLHPPGAPPGPPQPHVYEIFIRLPGMVGPQLHSKIQSGSIDKATAAASALFYDNGSILEVRIVKTDSSLILPV